MAKAKTNLAVTATPPLSTENINRRGVLPAELKARIETTIAGAAGGTFATDPLMGDGLSRLSSFLSSLVKRDGAILEAGICMALRRHSHMTVMTQVRMPITVSAEMLVQANDGCELRRIALPADGAATRIAHFDMIVVDKQEQVARLVEVKRGGGETEIRKRRTTERDLLCGRLQLKAYLKTLGITVRHCESWVVDYYGRSGFRPDLAVTREGLDQLFGVPVVATTEAAAYAMRAGMLQRLPRFLGRVRERQDVDLPVGVHHNDDLPLGAELRYAQDLLIWFEMCFTVSGRMP